MTSRGRPNHKANIWTARVIPFLLLALSVYSSWVFTKLLIIDYLLTPSTIVGTKRRAPQAIVIIVIYYLLLIAFLVCYTRLIATIIFNPGFVPRGPEWHRQQKRSKSSGRSRQQHRPSRTPKSFDEKENPTVYPGHDDQKIQVQDFWMRDLFICQFDGRPPFCSRCFNYKLDRVHHCSEVDRCVRKMDHFCPWVGGIISETSFKFFIQLTFYSAFYTLHILVVMAYYFAERRSREPEFLNAHWAIVLGFAGLFLLFSVGMFSSSFQLTWINSTTVENLSRKSKVYYLAVYLPRPEEAVRSQEAAGNKALRTITYPRPLSEYFQILEQNGAMPTPSAAPPTSRSTEQPTAAQGDVTGAVPSRTFAIVEATPGTNPWDLGTLENIQQVLGYRLIDWFLPIQRSPCASHDSSVSMFKMSPDLQDFKKAIGVSGATLTNGEPSQHRKSKRRRRSGSGAATRSAQESDGAQRRKLKRKISSRSKYKKEKEKEAAHDSRPGTLR